jgi:hypothetical protein
LEKLAGDLAPALSQQEFNFCYARTGSDASFGLRTAPMLGIPSFRHASLRSVAASCLLVGAVGCGRPATVEDCEQIVTRIAELELKEVDVSDAIDVKSQIAGTQAAFRERLMTDCVGRRLRPSTLECLNKAQSAETAIKSCF